MERGLLMLSFCFSLSWTDVNTSCADVVTLAIAADAAALDIAAPKNNSLPA